MKPFDDDFAKLLLTAAGQMGAIRMLLARANTLKRGHDKRLRQGLGHIYSLGTTLLARGAVQAFVVAQGGSWGKVAQGNPYQALCLLAFQSTTEATDISKYAAILAFARKRGVPTDQFEDWLTLQGVAKAYEASRADVNDKLSEYAETESARLERALAALNGAQVGDQQNVGAASIPSLLDIPVESLANLRKAIVEVTDGSVRVLKILPSTAAELAREVRNAVAPAGDRTGRSLREKPLYDLFCACDYHVRLAPEVSQPSAVFMEIPEPDDIDFEEWTESFASRKTQPLFRPPEVQRGIRLHYDEGSWVAESISTALAFAGFRISVSGLPDNLKPTEQFIISDKQARKLAVNFRAPGDWSLALRKPGHLAEENQLLLDRFSSILNSDWRTIIIPQAASPTISISHFDLDAALVWLAAFGQATGLTTPKLFALSWVQNQLTLVAPSHAKLSDMSSAYSRGIGTTLDVMPAGIISPDHWILTSDLRRLADFGKAYGLPLQLTLGEGVEGLSAVNLSVENGIVTLPLAVTLTGEYAETVEAIHRMTSSSAIAVEAAT